MKPRKILIPFFTPFISPLLPSLVRLAGYECVSLPPSDARSAALGLQFANNEVCYPATLIVGDVLRALQSGAYDPASVCVAMTQTGGQCRASNYVPLIRRALREAGFGQVPVVSLTFGGEGIDRIEVDWPRMLPACVRAVLFSDAIAKLFYPTACREVQEGEAERLRRLYLSRAAELIERGQSRRLWDLLQRATSDFSQACRSVECPRVGIVGEIFLKFNPFANRRLAAWLMQRGIEPVPSALTDFFLQAFVNQQASADAFLTRRTPWRVLWRLAYRLLRREVARVNRLCAAHPFFLPLRDIFRQARDASSVVNLGCQAGEGWLLPAEVMGLYAEGVRHVVSVQPFGCIANHIVGKGIEARLQSLMPGLHLLSLDFDSGVSDANVANRLLLFIHGLKSVKAL